MADGKNGFRFPTGCCLVSIALFVVLLIILLALAIGAGPLAFFMGPTPRDAFKNSSGNTALAAGGNGPLTFPNGQNLDQIGKCLDEWMKKEVPNSPLIGKGTIFAQKSQAANVNPALMVAIARQESVLNTAGGGPSTNNPFGLLDERSNFLTFPNLESAIDYHASYLRKGYLGPPWNLTTIEEIGKVYAPTGASNDPNSLNQHWIANVKKFYADILRHCPELGSLFTQTPQAQLATQFPFYRKAAELNIFDNHLADKLAQNSSSDCLRNTNKFLEFLAAADESSRQQILSKNTAGRGTCSFANAPGFKLGNRDDYKKSDLATNIAAVRTPPQKQIEVTRERLQNGRYVQWHVLGNGSGQHWITVLALDDQNQITFYDPANGQIHQNVPVGGNSFFNWVRTGEGRLDEDIWGSDYVPSK